MLSSVYSKITSVIAVSSNPKTDDKHPSISVEKGTRKDATTDTMNPQIVDKTDKKKEKKEKKEKKSVEKELTIEEMHEKYNEYLQRSNEAYFELCDAQIPYLSQIKYYHHAIKANIRTLPGCGWGETNEYIKSQKDYCIDNMPNNYNETRTTNYSTKSHEKETKLIKPYKSIFEGDNGVYISGFHHNYHGVKKIFPLKTKKGTTKVFFPYSGPEGLVQPVYDEDLLLPPKEDMIREQREKELVRHKLKGPIVKIKVDKIDMSRLRVANDNCNVNDSSVDDGSVYQRYIGNLNNAMNHPKQNASRQNQSVCSSKNSGINLNVRDLDGSIDSTLRRNIINSEEYQENQSSIGALRSSHLNEVSLLPRVRIPVKLVKKVDALTSSIETCRLKKKMNFISLKTKMLRQNELVLQNNLKKTIDNQRQASNISVE